MPIIFHSDSQEFHLYNHKISYLIHILENGQLANLYFGPKIADKPSFSYLLQKKARSLAVYVKDDSLLSMEHMAQEYPSYGSGDFHEPAFSVTQTNGSSISDFCYVSHRVYPGKKPLEGLPATYTEEDGEADSLEITLVDQQSGIRLLLTYTLFSALPAIARNVRFENIGDQEVTLERAMSLSVDLPGINFDMVYLAGAWSRERYPKTHRLTEGIQRIGSLRGISSSEYNPFFALKRPQADEFFGEVYAFSLVYSGNFLAQVEADTYGMTRAMIGIHPDTFSWRIRPGESFQTPEAVTVYTDEGLNGMSQIFHRLYGRRLARGPWRDRERPIVFNNWEVTEMDFDENKILRLAKKAAELGAEVFVLDDGWFGERNNEMAGLGDWVENRKKLSGGISGLADQIESFGMKFGLWIEPEMVNLNSNLYRAHPDWVLHTPGRTLSVSRHQYVLDFSRPEVVDAIYHMLHKLLSNARISYVKWDMNRYLTECYSVSKPPCEQGKVFHQYILGVYRLYEKLLDAFPSLLIESCSSGGSRFDPGILYYAPQGWVSDDTDAMERIKIQYGTSFVYPQSSMCTHVTMVPNQQVGRTTPLATRANVAMFGVFGLELDVCGLDEKEFIWLTHQISFIKNNRRLLQFGAFWRLSSPFAQNIAAWITVSPDQKHAIAACYQLLEKANPGWSRIHLAGLNPDLQYIINGNQQRVYGGDELVRVGLILEQGYFSPAGDFVSAVFDIVSLS